MSVTFCEGIKVSDEIIFHDDDFQWFSRKPKEQKDSLFKGTIVIIV